MHASVEEFRTEQKPDCLQDSYEVMSIHNIYNIYIKTIHMFKALLSDNKCSAIAHANVHGLFCLLSCFCPLHLRCTNSISLLMVV
jgi:hypothetical protein